MQLPSLGVAKPETRLALDHKKLFCLGVVIVATTGDARVHGKEGKPATIGNVFQHLHEHPAQYVLRHVSRVAEVAHIGGTGARTNRCQLARTPASRGWIEKQ